MRISKELALGLFYITLAVLFLSQAIKVPFGTLSEMNAGYYPTILAVILILFGIASVARGLRIAADGPLFDVNSLRPIVWVTASVIAFAACVRPLGFLVATVLALLLCSFAVGKPKPLPAALLIVTVTAASWLIFIVGLGLPWPLMPF